MHRGPDTPTCIVLAGIGLRAGRTLDAIFQEADPKQLPPRYRPHHTWKVTAEAIDTYRIAFSTIIGKQKGPGDGATWTVTFINDEVAHWDMHD